MVLETLKTTLTLTLKDSGVHEQRQGRAGVAVVLSEGVGRCVKSWKCVSERIVVVKVKVARVLHVGASLCSNRQR